MSESGGSSSQTAGTLPWQIMNDYTSFLPSYLQQNTGQISPYAQAIAQAGQQSVQGAGGQTAGAVSNLSNTLNPALATANTAAANANNATVNALPGVNSAVNAATQGAQNQLNAINLNGLSPGEYNATERSLNQTNTGTGNLGLLNPTNTIANAMNFGGAFNSKIPLYNTAVGTATNAANAASGAMTGASSAFGNASNAGSSAANAMTGSNSGMNAVANPAALATTSSLTNAGLLNQVSQGNFSNGNSSNQSAGANCCFIFMEAYNGQMPASVREFRDKYYRLQPTIADGYKRMAKWLVPLMREYGVVRSIVWHTMIKPATNHTLHPMNNWNKRVSRFWLKLWAIYGKI